MTDPKPPVGQQAEVKTTDRQKRSRAARKKFLAGTTPESLRANREKFARESVASPVTLSGERLKFCIPSDRQPQYLLMYDDPEVGFSLFDSKEDAMMAFAAANIGWDVWLFEPVAVTLSEGQDTQEKKS